MLHPTIGIRRCFLSLSTSIYFIPALSYFPLVFPKGTCFLNFQDAKDLKKNVWLSVRFDKWEGQGEIPCDHTIAIGGHVVSFIIFFSKVFSLET